MSEPWHYTTLTDLLDHWQPLIAGVLALCAGIAAYTVGKQQVRAANAQTAAVILQNIELKNENRRKLAREGIVAVRMLNAVLAQVDEGIAALNKILNQPTYFKTDATMPLEYRQKVPRQELSIVWPHLGACGFEIVDKYLMLNIELENFTNSPIPTVHIVQNSLQKITNLVRYLRDELEKEAARCNAVLSQTASD